jgi:hypothetical protein
MKRNHTPQYIHFRHMAFTINWYTTTEKLEFLFRFEMDTTILNNSLCVDMSLHSDPLF